MKKSLDLISFFVLKNWYLYWIKLFQEIGKRRLRRRILIFLVCVFLAAAFWILNILGKSYKFELESKIAFENLPEDKALSLEQAPIVLFTVEGTGWNFLKSKMQFLKDTLTFDLRKTNSKDEIDLNKALLDFEKQWDSKLKIVNVFPSKIIFNLEQKKIRKLPIRVQSNISFKENYNISSPITISPDSVYVKGPIELIKKLNYVETEPVVLQKLDKSVQLNVKVNAQKYPNIIFSNNDLKLHVPVEQFTENIIEIPININQEEINSEILLFPSVCQVKFKVALSEYPNIIAQSFRVFAERNKHLSNRLSLRLVSQPEFIKDVEIIPETVEYLKVEK